MNWPSTDDDIIRQVVIFHEGGFVNDPRDAGHATNYGITQDTLSVWRGHTVTIDDVRNMPMSEAIAIYHKKYITAPGFDLIQDMRLRTALVDAAVLFGQQTVIKALQGILGLTQDGVLGPATAAKAATQESRGTINALSVWRVLRHANRCQADPSQVVFLKGWISRACEFVI